MKQQMEPSEAITPLQELQGYEELIGYVIEKYAKSSQREVLVTPENGLGVKLMAVKEVLFNNVTLTVVWDFNGKTYEVSESYSEFDCQLGDNTIKMKAIKNLIGKIVEELTADLEEKLLAAALSIDPHKYDFLRC